MNKQYFKSVYYTDYPSSNSNEKSITIAFNNEEFDIFSRIKDLSNHEIRNLINIEKYIQLVNLAREEDRSINYIIKKQIKKNILLKDGIVPIDGTFIKSKGIPFQRWYPYIEGYSPDYVKSLIQKYLSSEVKTIYDPFIGTGTTIFGADDYNIKTIYSEINPLLQFIIETKIKILKLSNIKREQVCIDLLGITKNIHMYIDNCAIDNNLDFSYKLLFSNSVYFEKKIYEKILRSRTLVNNLILTDELLGNIIMIAVLSCLIPSSFLKKQGDVRFKTELERKKENIDYIDQLQKKLFDMIDDINNFEYKLNTFPFFILSNAKNIGLINELNIDAVLTSPPYLNGTNYFRNTKLELWFMQILKSPNDLRSFRDQVLTSGINDVNKINIFDEKIFKKSIILQNAYKLLQNNAYDKRIPIMVNRYFYEMHLIFNDLIPILNKGSRVIIDIGDSIFGGIHVPTDDILVELFSKKYNLIDRKEVRKRRSKNNMLLRQSLLIFEKKELKNRFIENKIFFGKSQWDKFKNELPQKKLPYSKKNWGHPNHSICSFQGKLKPSIAHHLVNTFVPENGTFLDIFSGVGTIPFEGALTGKKAFGMDISKPAFYISSAKVGISDSKKCFEIIADLENYINQNKSKINQNIWKDFGFNKSLNDYYEPQTFKEILSARNYFFKNSPKTTEEMLVISSLLHILHGNRPYALSRRSHPIVPYAPTGAFEYKSLIEKLKEKVAKTIKTPMPQNFVEGKIFLKDTTEIWPQEIFDIDAIITSPPFFDSTRFYLANWIRIWFAGWDLDDFKYKTRSFIEEKQKVDFSIYEPIFRQAKERLKKDAVFVLHLGKSKKCDMAKELQRISRYWFKSADLFDENVAHCQKHGIRDMGTVTSHQYLILV